MNARHLVAVALAAVSCLLGIGFAISLKQQPEQLAINQPLDAKAVGDLFGISYTADELKEFGPPPAAQPGYFTFFDPGWSIKKMRESTGDTKRHGYDDESFAYAQDKPGYRQLNVNSMLNDDLTWDESLAWMPKGDTVAPARVVATAMLIAYKKKVSFPRSEKGVGLRCSDSKDGKEKYHVLISDNPVFAFGIVGYPEDSKGAPVVFMKE